ncbi:MAG TPA: GYD domain-containing protein [Acidimicrobiia bacterium]|nr:GYD domain-containing protein [Acidimicrobiia bacterium]
MPKYLSLFSYSEESLAAMIDNPVDREPAIARVLESVGARLDVFYWMFGTHDGMAVVDAPDSATMAAISAAISSTGTVHAETHELFSTDDIRKILQTAGRAREHFEPPGHG